jgi:hypothetical protein
LKQRLFGKEGKESEVIMKSPCRFVILKSQTISLNMKYRILTDEELSHLEDDFKQFLIVSGVHAEEWEEMNKTDISKAIQLVEIFSDTVLQKVYEKITFIEFRSEDSCIAFNCEKNKIKLIVIQGKKGVKVNLSTPELIHEEFLNNLKNLQFHRSEKEIKVSREMELHQLLEQGCVVSSKEFWEFLLKIIVAN